tara:strand:- start:11692 stop:11919 length:228 start_codon:yes stop_codon:yes gene_type:complete
MYNKASFDQGHLAGLEDAAQLLDAYACAIEPFSKVMAAALQIVEQDIRARVELGQEDKRHGAGLFGYIGAWPRIK